MILVAVFVCLCLASAFNFYKTRKQRMAIRNLKGPLTLPLMGSMQKVLLLTPRNFFRRSSAYLAKYGQLSRCWVFDRLFIVTTDSDFVSQLLHSPEHTHMNSEHVRDFLGPKKCEDETSQQRHPHLAALFSKTNLTHLNAVSVETAQRLIQSWNALATQREVFDLWPHVSGTVLDIMLATTLGLKPIGEAPRSAAYAAAFRALIEVDRARYLNAKASYKFIYCITCPRLYTQEKKLIKQLKQFNLEIICEVRQREEEEGMGLDPKIKQISSIAMDNDCLDKGRTHNTLLSLLLTAKSLTDIEISHCLNKYIYQGYLHVSTAICFTLTTIARHPSVQANIVAELHAKENGSQQGFDYLESVIKESLRLYPPQPVIKRVLSKDFPYTQTQLGAGIMPKGAEVYINSYEMLRNPAKFRTPTASHFEPMRNQAGNAELYFGMGPSSCPAQSYSMLLIKSIVACILSSYEVLPHGDA